MIHSSDTTRNLKGKLVVLYGFLLAANVLVWIWAMVAFHDYPLLLGTGLLAYTFGLRHAVDADHIAAIDNVTRKLMQEGKRPVAVGLFFSLGHSTVVVALSIFIAAATASLQDRISGFKEMGGMIGTGVSIFFLFAIAIANFAILMAVYRTFRNVKRGGPLIEAEMDLILSRRGLLGRILRRLFRLIGQSWHMYPLGVLFGLGFDTATEIGLLGISASQSSRSLPVWSILVFPFLFTAGMSLVDSIDSSLMLGAYDWAFIKPIRKLYYNMTITLVSVMIAFLIGGVEVLGLISVRLGYRGPFWEMVGSLNEHFGVLGFVIIALFLLSWIASFFYYRFKRYDEIEVVTIQ